MPKNESATTSAALKSFTTWAAVLITTFGAVAAAVLILRHFYGDRELFGTLLAEHVRAVVGIPMAAASAFCVLLVFEARAGQVEFEAVGFKFRGGAGPAVIWVFAFLAFVSAIRLLW